MPDTHVATRPAGIDAFDVARQRFLDAFVAFVFDPAVPGHLREAEWLATVSALTQISVLAEVGVSDGPSA